MKSTDHSTLRVASVQMESLPAQKEANFTKVQKLTREAAGLGAKVVLFPECCLTGYWFLRNLSEVELRELAEPIPNGQLVTRLRNLALSIGITIGAGLVESDSNGKLFNSYVVATSLGEIHCHRKLHAFEHPCVSSGDQYTVFDLPEGWRVGVLICYDCNIGENVRINALRGADVILAPHQTGAVRSKNPHLMGLIDRKLWDERETNPTAIESEFRGEKGRGWLMRWLPSRAHDNGVFLVFSNGVGVDDDEIRTGNAMILDPYGRVISETGVAADAMVVADLDRTLLGEATGRKWIRARRPTLYQELSVPTGNECDTRKLKFEE